MSNTHPTTGVRYGVIACASLDPDLVNDLMYGAGAKDLSYQAAYEEAKKRAEKRADEIEEDVKAFASEHGVVEAELEAWLEQAIEAAYERLGYQDREDLIECDLQQFSDCYESNEPTIEGEYEGVKYRISWLGGAPLLWVIEGPQGYVNNLCSPCVPNAGDLDSGFIPGNAEDPALTLEQGQRCYVVPRDWLASTNED